LKDILTGIFNILDAKERVKLGKLILSDLVIGLLDIFFLGLLLVVINFYTKSSYTTTLSFLPAGLINEDSLLLIGVFFALFTAKNWLGYLNSKAQHHFFYDISSRLSKINIETYLKGDYLQFVNIDSSVLIRKISQQPIEFSNYILTNFQQIISQSILILFTIIAILFYHPALFFLLFALLLPPVVVLGYFIKKKLKTVRADTKITSEKTIQHLNESLSGFIESNLYEKEEFFVERYFANQQQLNNNIATQHTLQGLTSRLVEVFAILGFFVLVAINKLSVNSPAVSVFTIGVFMAAAYKIIPGIIKILNSAGQIKTYEFTLDDLKTESAETIITNEPHQGKINSIIFEQVKFKYKDHTILNSVSFELSPGEIMGISAKSGVGKTTIVHLLLGFLKHHKGNIYINDRKTNWIERQSYWGRISYVKQQSFIINDTILKNITLSDGDHDAEKLADVISFCGIDNITAQYPEGINKFIKENGKNISGGQRQRIMLARALYHDFDLLILDEAFGEMDDISERSILAKLKLLAQQGKMIILITHNKPSLYFCDKIVSLDKEYA
jgi:ABC-type multidrug transport system fused ATPase/permease subunit